jgi:threonine dehydratase
MEVLPLSAVVLKDVFEARERISRTVKRTPLIRSAAFSDWSGFEVFLKAENLQKTGSFKIRGAANKVLSITPEDGRRGIVTGSSGNHGQAVAYIATRYGYEATVVMPLGGSPAKAASIKGYGANLIYCGTTSSERLAFAEKLRADKGAVFVHPYDDPFVIAGQGTVGIEIIEELEDASVILVPTGGCGLISGIAVAVKEKNPGVKIFGVEPTGSNSTGLSFKNGRRTALDKIETVADGIRTTIPGELTFPLVQKYVDGMIEVSEDEILYAQRMILERCKLLAEPTGAVSLAAVLSGALTGLVKGRKAVAVLSGGNASLAGLGEYLIRSGPNA